MMDPSWEPIRAAAAGVRVMRSGSVVGFQRKKTKTIATKAPFPGFIEPELATSADKVPSGER